MRHGHPGGAAPPNPLHAHSRVPHAPLSLAIMIIVMVALSGSAVGRHAPERTSAGDRLPANEPPDVRILQPDASRHFAWGAQFRYSISVSDTEDGESVFGELEAHEVLLEVAFLPAGDRDEALPSSDGDEPVGLALMRKSTCFTCHADKTSLVGPSFAAIAGAYPHDANTADRLGRHVRDGSSGTWGTLPMPPHSHFSPMEATSIVQYILEQGQQRHRWVYAGLEGTVRIVDKPDDTATGSYRLTASYLDDGVAGVPGTGRRGEHTITLHVR
jgi:cytochrome c